METYWVPGVNNLKTYGRWSFAELTEVYQFDTNFEARVEQAVGNLVGTVTATSIDEPRMVAGPIWSATRRSP